MTESEFRFLGFRVSEVVFKVSDSFGHAPGEFSNKIHIENNFATDQPRFVEVVLDVRIESASKDFLFSIKLKGGFRAADTMDEDLFKKLAQTNAPAILFPFARSIIASYAAQANIPPIVIPVVNLTQEPVVSTTK